MKNLFIVALFFGSACYGQSLGYTPPANAAFLSTDGTTWNPWTSALGSSPLGYQPPAIGLYCQAAANGPWTPCAPTASSSGTVTSVSAGTLPSFLGLTVANPTTTPTLNFTATAIPNSALANASTTINGTAYTLGASGLLSTLIGDATATPSTLTQVTSTNSGSTTGLPAGYGCSIQHSFVSGSNYTATASCTNNVNGTLQAYLSASAPLGSENYAALFTATTTGQNFAGTTQSSGYTTTGQVTATRIAANQIRGQGIAPTCAVGAGAGTGATCSATGFNLAGVVTVNTGTVPTGAAILATLTFSTTQSTAPQACFLQPTNSSAAGNAGMVFTTAPTTTTWTITEAISAPSASSTFTWGYLCI